VPEGPLTIAQLGDLARATLTNSLRLLNEAEALYLLERYPTAEALATLAAEEFGKHMMCFGAVGAPEDHDEFWKDFWKRFKSHRPKYENVVSMAVSWLENEESRRSFLKDFRKHVDADLERKLAGLYVDVEAGQIIPPWEAIAPQNVHGSLTVLTAVIRHWAEGWGDADFAKVFEEGLARGAGDLWKAVKAKDRETIARFFSMKSDDEA
jgi:AbiV family abortive infection protein